MKRQVNLIIQEQKLEQNLPLYKELEENGFLKGNGKIEYDDEDPEAEKRIREIFERHHSQLKR